MAESPLFSVGQAAISVATYWRPWSVAKGRGALPWHAGIQSLFTGLRAAWISVFFFFQHRLYLEEHPTDRNWLVTGVSSPTYK